MHEIRGMFRAGVCDRLHSDGRLGGTARWPRCGDPVGLPCPESPNQFALSFADDAYDEMDRLKHAADSDGLKALARQLIDISQRMM